MIPLDVEVFVALEPIDLRVSFDLLSGLVRDRLSGDPKSGALFVFFGKRKDKLKALFYDKTGFCILYKRLCRGTFRIPECASPSDASVRIDEDELVALFDGIPLPERGEKRKLRFH
jgi:transposase